MKRSNTSAGRRSHPAIRGYRLDALGIAFVISLILVIGSCSPETGNAEANQTIRIGGVFHLTGPGAFWGQGELNGAMMAVEELNGGGGVSGKKLSLIVEDGKTDFPATASALRKLIEIDQVNVIVGPTWFGQVAAPIADKSGVVIVSPSAGTVPSPSPFFFDVWPTEQQEISAEVSFMKNRSVRTVAVVFSQNDWSQSMRDHFNRTAEAEGIKVVKEFPTSPDERDFRTVIAEITGLKVDAVYAPFAFYPSQGEFSKQAAELEFDTPLYSSSGTENPNLIAAFPSVEGTIYPYPKAGLQESGFREKYESRFRAKPSPSAAYAYDAVMILARAMRDSGTSSEELRTHLGSLKGYQGVANEISFDKNGRVLEKPHLMKIVKGGKFQELTH